ncbi:MAG: hypothetical protein KJ072_14145 [Verrucomicrobia bacterium]|nr:hypothetical protein [Verrucomicrobiota bacterium]
MSTHPNRLIEEQLRAYAESRRQQAPLAFELDVASRRRLREEVRCVYRTEPEAKPAGGSWKLWLRVGLAATAAALVLFVSARFLPGEQPLLLSLAERSPEPDLFSDVATERSVEPVGHPTVSIEPTAVPVGSLPELAALGVSDHPGDALVQDQDASRHLAPPEPASSERAARPKAQVTSAAPPAATPPVAPAVRSQLSFGAAAGGQEMAGDSQPGQDFSQVQRYRRNPNSPPPPQVLQAFKWVRDGDTVRVIDADGSVYTGKIEMAEATPIGDRFVISGTNRTLNAGVVFEGVWLRELAGQQLPTYRGSAAASTVDAAVQIQGRATVGGSTRLEIMAVPRAE